MSSALATGLMTRWNSSAGATVRALATGGLWTPFAPESKEDPLVTFVFLPGTTDGTMKADGIRYIENEDVQFTVFVDEYQLELGWSILTALKALFDNHTPTLSTGTCLICKRMSAGQVIDQPEGGFGLVVDYRYTIQEA